MIPTPFVLSCLPETPSQTAGPYVHIGLIPNQAGFDIFQNNFSGDIAGPDVAGQRIVIEGKIFDGAGHVAKDVLVETWQANAAGRYNHPADNQKKSLDQNFRGWARTGTDFGTGLYTIRTIKPGSVVGRKGRKAMAPHVNFWLAKIYMRDRKSTRLNSSHANISYAVFCLKKKKQIEPDYLAARPQYPVSNVDHTTQCI